MVGRNCSAFALSLGVVFLLTSCGDGTGPTEPLGGLFSVANGDDHVCLLQLNGSTHCWGWGGFGQLGAGDTLNYRAPTKVQGGLEFAAIASGSAHTCGLTHNGTAYCWGGNAVGALGKQNTIFLSKLPVKVDGSLRFSSISAGTGYTCGVALDGAGYCWGSGGSGELGTGVDENTFVPTPVAGNLRFNDISTSLFHTCGLIRSGAAYCWGDNLYGMLGSGDLTNHSTPTPVLGGVVFKQIGTGDFFSCGLTDAGQAWCWGSNVSNELGNGTQVNHVTEPVQVVGGQVFVKIAVGSYHACGITASFKLYCWGSNTYGKLGIGSTLSTTEPVLVNGNHRFVAVSAGGNHTCGIAQDEGALCWGWNALGQLGNGKRDPEYLPVEVIPTYRE
jgi:alpha-tubulin suppressor-like RCC1 family protein